MAKLNKRKSKKIMTNILSITLMVMAIIALFGYALPTYSNAQNLGISVGDKTGTIVGKVIGSYNGVTKGLAEGSKVGHEDGLSATDTKSKIQNSFSEIGNLEVLEAGVKLSDVNTLGEEYAALYILKGVAIYSVNLNDVEINDSDANTVEVLLPEINVEVYIDESSTEKLAEYQKNPWAGSARDGFVEYMNSRSVMDQSVKDTMENYSAMTEAAQSSAIKQIEIIAKAATGNKKEVVVSFKEGQADEK